MAGIKDSEDYFSKIAPILEKNRIFHNRHSGERCFILATGPSINKQNLRFLKGERCLAMSNFYLHPEFEIIKPQYYCYAPFHPPTQENTWHSLMMKLEKATYDAVMFFGLSDFGRNQKDGLFSGRQIFFLDFSGSWQEASVRGIDLTFPVPEIVSGSIMALMIAIYMGFQKIYLLGCDLSWILRYFGYDEHFHISDLPQMNGAGFNEDYYPSVEYEFFCNYRLLKQFRALHEIAGKRSISIYNATPGGLLDVFPRVEFDSIFLEENELINGKAGVPLPFSRLKLEKIKRVLADDNLSNVKQAAMVRRYGNWEIKFWGLTIYCHDLLSFYMGAKDIFLNRIYDFKSITDHPIVIDGGGHIGLFTLFVKKKYPNARITVFEPDREFHYLLKKNLSTNLIDDVKIVEAGLYKEKGKVPFCKERSDGSSIHGREKNTSIPVMRLSSYLDEEVDFLKLNIEGAEFDVFPEIEDKLNKVREMVIEYHGFPETGQNLHWLLTMLDNSGFRYMIHDFDSETNSATKPPFQLTQATRFFLLIYAKKLFSSKRSHCDEPVLKNNVISAEPVSRQFGFDRGMPIDRYYIEKFLKKNKSCIRGAVLEIGDDSYTKKYGTGVTCSDVLNIVPTQKMSIVGDLATGENIPSDRYDCIIMTQTIQMVYDVKSALKNAVRALKENGTLLITASGISQISRYDMDRWGEYWRFTDKSLKLLLAEFLPENAIQVEAYGNVAAAKAFLDGQATHELPNHILDYQDRDYQVVLTARACKKNASCTKGSTDSLKAKIPDSFETPLILLYHRVAHDRVNAQLLAVTPENFEAHLEELSGKYRVIPLYELLNELRQGILEPDTVALTFDDGYMDNLSNAVPLLEAKGLHATVFVTSGMVGSNFDFWWDSMERVFLQNHPLPDSLEINCSKGTFQWNLASPHDRVKAHDELCEILRLESAIEANRFIDRLHNWAGVAQIVCENHRILNADQIRKLSASPSIEIGSHTVTHTRLSSLSSQLQREEIARSKAQLESLTRKSIRFFSYPYGNRADFTKETQRLVADAGYEAGISNMQGNIVAPVEMYAIPRRLVRDWPGEVFSKWLGKKDKDSLEDETNSMRYKRLTAYPTKAA